MSVIVTGGAGYIGSHVVAQLQERGEEIVIVDDLSSGLESRVSGHRVHKIDLSLDSSVQELHELALSSGAKSIIHFAAKKSAPESVTMPEYYFRQNVGSLLNVIAALHGTQVTSFVFSSSAAVYGDARGQVFESAPTLPMNPYGDSKLMGEQILNRESALGVIKVANLRYFNVAGTGSPALADTSVSNLIPMVFGKIVQALPPQIFGDDYETPDGSCIRDYIHVVDLAAAHISALNYLKASSVNHSEFNIGTGLGYSVKEVLAVVKEVTGFDGNPEILPRRSGDPAQIIANVTRAHKELGWKSKLSLEDMVRSAWEVSLYNS
jgi:UDP-glucose 4-epimerase